MWLNQFLLLGAVLFCIGVYGVLARRNGVGSLLADHVTNRARILGHRTLFLYTEHSVDWYRAKGWTVVREMTLNDLPHTVMHKDL